MAFCSEKSISLVSIILLIDRDPLRQSRAERIRANDTFALTHCNNNNKNNNNNNNKGLIMHFYMVAVQLR